MDHRTDPNTNWWGPILNGKWPGPAGMVSMGTIVPSAAVMFTPKSPAFDQHGAEPVNCTTNSVVRNPPLVEVVRALLGNSVNSLPPHCGRLAGAGCSAAAGTRSTTDRTPAGFHGTGTAVEVAGGATLVLLANRVDDGVPVAVGTDVLIAEGSGAGAAHPAAVISSNTPTSATKFARILITSRSVGIKDVHGGRREQLNRLHHAWLMDPVKRRAAIGETASHGGLDEQDIGAGGQNRRCSDASLSSMRDDPTMDRQAPRYTPSVLLIVGFICAVVVLTLGVIDRDWWSAALGRRTTSSTPDLEK